MPLPLYPYQIAGAAFLTQTKAWGGRAGLLDDPGVGKTATAIRALDILGYDRNVIVVPAAIRKNWINEFNKFQTRYRRIVEGRVIHDFVAWQRGHFDTIITSYEQASKWTQYILESGAEDILDAVIFDEAHGLRNDATKRVQTLLGPTANGIGGLLQFSKHAWWLTGTPIWNDPQDIWTFLRFCNVMPLNKTKFMQRYFNSRATTYSTRNAVKPAMLPELRSLISNNSIRRSFEDAGIELPPIFFTTATVDGDTQAVRDLLQDYPGLDQRIIDALREDRGLSNLDADHIETLRRLIGEAKAIPYAQMLLNDLHGGVDKAVVFGIHRNALTLLRDHLRKHGIDCAVFNGDTTGREDERNLARFDHDPTLRVLACNLTKGGVGLNMVVSCHVDVLESAWTPNGNWQAIRRLYRIGQLRTVRARFISLADSFDQIVTDIVAEKAANIAALSGPIL